jgi:flavin-dependent dehydrogenase
VEIYDVVIVGGGPAGATAAIVLAGVGKRVLLLDAQNPSGFKIGESLPPAAKTLLQEIDVWDDFVLDKHLPCYGNMSAWGNSLLQTTDFIFDPNGHGWHLNRIRFDTLLHKKAIEAGAEIKTNAVLKQCRLSASEDKNLWVLNVSLQNRNLIEIKSRFIIDASGRSAVIARSQAVKCIADDKLIACYALFKQSDLVNGVDEDSRTIIESVPEGWWYSALLPDGNRIVVFHTDSDLINISCSIQKPARFISLFQKTKHISRIIKEKNYQLNTQPKITTARSARLEKFYGEGWLAAGDSALAFDPLSSQGIITAIYTGLKAGFATDDYLSGNSTSLKEYNQNLTKIYDAYRYNLQNWYAIERRWLNFDFWFRRCLLKTN